MAKKEKLVRTTGKIQVGNMRLLHTTDWLMCVCRADTLTMTVVFMSCSRLL